jgi:hypothetical protein
MSDVYDFWEEGICYEDAVPLPNSPVGLTGIGDVVTCLTQPLLVSRVSVAGVLRGMDVAVTDIGGEIHTIAEQVSSEDGFDSGEFAPILAVLIRLRLTRPSFVKELVVLKTIELSYSLRDGTSTGSVTVEGSDTCKRQLVSQEVSIQTDLKGEHMSIMADWNLAHLIKGFNPKLEDPFKDYDPLAFPED